MRVGERARSQRPYYEGEPRLLAIHLALLTLTRANIPHKGEYIVWHLTKPAPSQQATSALKRGAACPWFPNAKHREQFRLNCHFPLASVPRLSVYVACSKGTGFVKCHMIYSPLCDIFALVKVNSARHYYLPLADAPRFSADLACAQTKVAKL